MALGGLAADIYGEDEYARTTARHRALCQRMGATASGKAYADPFNEIEVGRHRPGRRGPHVAGARLLGRRPGVARALCARPPRAPTPIARYAPTRATPTCTAGRARCERRPTRGATPSCATARCGSSADRRHIEHVDGTPFFWLGDTWWMALTQAPALARGVRAAGGRPRGQGLQRRSRSSPGCTPTCPPTTSAASTRPGTPGSPTTRASTRPTSTRPTCACGTWCAWGWCPASWAAGAITCPGWGWTR